MNTPAASAPIATKRAAPRKTARPPEAKTQAAAPEKAQIRTMLVPSCGWPTDAALPDRKRTTKR